MRTDFFIASKLKLRQRGSRRSSVSIKVSTIGVVLSIAVMLLTIAIVTGFKQQITDKIIGFESELTLTAVDSDMEAEKPIHFSDTLMAVVRKSLEKTLGTAAAKRVEVAQSLSHPAMLKTADNFSAAVVRGFAGSGNDAFLRENLVAGYVPDFMADSSANQIVISSTMADRLNLKAGEKINTVFFTGQRLRLRNFKIAGVYCSNFGEYDNLMAFGALSTLQKIWGIAPEESICIEITGIPFDQITAAEQGLQADLSQAYYAGSVPDYIICRSVLESGAIYFNWLHLLDTNVMVIIALMASISVFTLIASLFILILERINMIGTLKTLGATDSLIRRVFIILASRILVRGLIIGDLLALAIIIIQSTTHILPLDAEAYYISFVPMEISFWQVLTVNVAAVAAGVAVMVIPSMVISRMTPAKTVRFE